MTQGRWGKWSESRLSTRQGRSKGGLAAEYSWHQKTSDLKKKLLIFHLIVERERGVGVQGSSWRDIEFVQVEVQHNQKEMD